MKEKEKEKESDRAEAKKYHEIFKNDTLEDKIIKLKTLNIAYQSAIVYDNCPCFNEAEEIKENEYFAEGLELGEIRTALKLYEGWSPSDFESKIISAIGCL